MKLLVRQYLASLRERGELDSILPDLLSESGFHVYSRPQRGTTQHGVDVAATGKDESDGEEKVFLFSIKSGDLTRSEWSGDRPQSLRASLDEIKDAYIPSRIPVEHAGKKIVICICFGGDVQEQVQPSLRGYTRQNTTDLISYQEWNGERLAALILAGVLREDLLPKTNRSNFQKAVAMVDVPDVSYRYFLNLTNQLLNKQGSTDRDQISSLRQLYICLWIIFVWARDADNVESPYRASELAVLRAWDYCRPQLGVESKHASSMFEVLDQIVQLHLAISFHFLEGKILPHASKRDGLSSAILSRSYVDVNQIMFEVLGRISMAGIWTYWLSERAEEENKRNLLNQLASLNAIAFQMISNNHSLLLPACDIQSIEISTTLLMAVISRGNNADVAAWLCHIANRLNFTLRTHGKYTCSLTDYRALIEHPRERTDDYRKDAVSGSTLIPLLVAWLGALGEDTARETLIEMKREVLPDCTLQFWLPGDDTEENLYLGENGHGIAFTELPIDKSFEEYIKLIIEACGSKNSFEKLSAVATGFWPIALMACRHSKCPVPPHFWISLL